MLLKMLIADAKDLIKKEEIDQLPGALRVLLGEYENKNQEQPIASPTEVIEKDERVAEVAAWLSNARAWQLQRVTELLANNAIFCTFQIGPADNEN